MIKDSAGSVQFSRRRLGSGGIPVSKNRTESGKWGRYSEECGADSFHQVHHRLGSSLEARYPGPVLSCAVLVSSQVESISTGTPPSLSIGRTHSIPTNRDSQAHRR